MSEEKTFQPNWGEKPKHHHHHHRDAEKAREDEKRMQRGIGGALRMRDKQAYFGLMLVVITICLFGIYKIAMIAITELRAMPMDDPDAEVAVDVLRIHRGEEQDALLAGDSLAHAYNLDSIRQTVQIETRPVYRPPRNENEWYITSREWKDIWNNYKRWRKTRHAGEETD